MGLGYDLDQFLDHCRMTKPPYECPHVSCVKIYKSFVGIQHHMTTYDHENPPPNVVTPKSARKKNLKRLPSPVPSAEPDVPSIPHSHDMKMVVFEIDGKTTELSVYDPIEILSKEEYEASMPPPVEEPPPQEQARTPSAKPQPKTPTQKTPKNRGNDKDRGLDVQKYTIEEKKTNKLPEANYRIITNYYPELPDAPPRPTNYFRYIEKTVEELDEEVEYDMDEEDRVWLEVMNEKREVDGLDVVDMETFEFLMDRLEKESFFQAQSSGKEPGVPIDEDAVCCICMDGECQNSNVILFCDMCNLAVHQECYGVPYIPEGQWLCRRCLQSPSRAVDCALCPNKGGAFKQTDDGRWAHVVCAMWIPEVCFANTVFLEPIDSIGNIPPARWKLGCYICKQRGLGACIQCNKINCYTAFHVTCAQQAGLHMKMDAVSETNANGTSVTVRKAAYCDVHTPADSDARPQVDEIMDSAKKAAAKAASRQKMRKARKILAEKRSAAPIVSVPTIPADKIQKLASTVSMQKKSQFMHRLLAFWTLKRQSRNGVPLLRRLTTSHSRRNNRAAAAAAAALVELDQKKEDKKVLSEAERLREEIKYWQRLRQDLERARLLCELIRKREKTKRELVKVKAEEKIIQLAPFVHLLLQTIDLIQDKDIHMIFAEPVDFDEVQDYLDVVKHPMDLSTMRQKAQAHQYRNVDDFASDFNLMIENCLKYNSKDTIFYRAGIKLRDQGGAIIRQLRRNVADVGFDMETGLLLSHRPKPLQEVSDNKIIREVDNALALDVDESISLEDREKYLLELLDKANLLRHHVARIKRVKFIRREITILRRKIAMNQSGSTCGRKVPVTYDTEDESDKEDSDPDDSSVIDDEAEPGERRPSPPPPPISLYPPIGSGLPSTPRRTLSFQGSTPTSARGAKRGRTSTPLGSSKIDPKQKRIDLYFPRVGRGHQHSSSSTPSSPMPPTEESQVPKIPTEAKVPSNKEKEDSPSIQQQEQPKRRGPGRPPKRSRTMSCPSNSPPAKKLEAELCEPASPVKSGECAEGEDPPSVPSSPSGVNRRTSVLFTKKKPENPSPQKRVGRPRKNSESGSPGSGRPVTALPAASSGPTFGAEACAGGPSDIKGKGGRKKKSGLKGGEVSLSGSSMTFPEGITILDLTDESLPPPKESFKIYRQGGEIPPETDEDTHSESNSSLTDTEEETASESESEGGESGESDDESSCGGGENSGQTGSDGIPLEPLDLVWAKCRGYPWYPALIINPKMPKTGYFHNGVPIPVPPNEVLALASNYELPIYLILFFDNKRTWQWLPRNKLEPLGVDSTLDKAKLVESRKPAERKAVKRAYEKAILHRCRVTGENTGLSGESDNEDHT